MTVKATPITKSGLAHLEEELDYLRRVRRQEVADRIRQAKDLTSVQNNPEYDDAKNERAIVEGRIRTIEQIIQNSYLIDEERAHHSDTVRLGSQVSVLGPGDRPQEFTIVGVAEVSPGGGRISNESPVGRGLLGKRVGDVVQVMAPAGIVRFTVLAIH